MCGCTTPRTAMRHLSSSVRCKQPSDSCTPDVCNRTDHSALVRWNIAHYRIPCLPVPGRYKKDGRIFCP